MSAINIFLKETDLTSTKNKFLFHSIERFREDLINCENFLLDEKERKRKIKTDPLYAVFEEATPVKKKKKKKEKTHAARYFHERSLSQERNDYLDGLNLAARSLRSSPRDGFRAAVAACHLADESVPSELGTAASDFAIQPAFAEGAVTSFSVNLASNLRSIPSFPPISPSFSNTAVTFGSPAFGGAVTSAYGANAKPLLRKTLFAAKQTPSEGFSDLFVSKVLAVDLSEMPVYSFSLEESDDIRTAEKITSLDLDEDYLLQVNKIQNLKIKKMKFVNATSVALMHSSKFTQPDDSYRLFLTKCADEVRVLDPEFILKVALYSRQELHIRSASNFLLSYAAFHESTRFYLQKYFDSTVRLPSDWIEVADIYQVFLDEHSKKKIPAALKKVMKKSFVKFDEYQLAKYNRRKLKTRKSFTLKQLIRALHIDSPVNSVMCLLGKKYPEDIKSFQASGLPGAWVSEMAGKRMKLPIPETWETQISLKGNKAAVWENLIDNSKLPYMAMLRNIRNLILSEISPKHHEKVLKHLENKSAVVNSRQLPIQFYEAFKTVVELELLINQSEEESSSLVSKFAPKWKIKLKTKMLQRLKNASCHILNRYKSSISKALELSALHNLHPVPGKTLVICDLLNSEKRSALGKSKVYPSCIMFALMCLRACEDCKVNIVGSSEYVESVTFDDDQFLSTMKRTCEKYEEDYLHSSIFKSEISLSKLFERYLEQRTVLSEKLDHIIFLRCCSFEFSDEIRNSVTSFLRKYRETVNPELLYTDVSFTFSPNSFVNMDSGDGKDVYLCGNSAQLLKFIAERSTGEQLLHIDSIDEKYNLPDISRCESKKLIVDKHLGTDTIIPFQPKIKKWHTVRIFISSTFKDMHAERDMLIRYVIPELRKRASTICVKINEVDLRWGITEADCSTKRATELCLLEAQKCDYFIGILGERYGTIFKFDAPDNPELKWVQEYPQGLSVTELEVHAGALREPKLSERKSFFYFRDNSTFIGQVPMEWKLHFMPENDEAKLKVGDLKSKILASGLKVYNGYPAQWAGVHNGKPILGGLDQFGYKVLEDLWNAISQNYKEETYSNIVTEEEMYQSELFDSCNHFVGMKNSPMDDLLKMIKKEGGIFVITGPPGSGKTAFVVNMLQSLSCFRVIKFFIGVSPRSTDIVYMLRFIMNSIAMHFPTLLAKSTEDIINQFPDFLIEAVKLSGDTPLLLLIDGLDHLEPDDQMLDWLPFNLPSGFRFVCTTSESSHAFRVLCERRESETAVIFHGLNVLNQFDRACLVRYYLKKYGKSLDESSFNNQMLQIITKKDSFNPLYLRTACDFLRIYASFDNFMSTLQSMPSTLSLLLGEIILQMENEYGCIVIQTVLTILCITKEGLDDKDLHFVLSFSLLENGRNDQLSFQDMLEKMVTFRTSVMAFSDSTLPQIKFCSLIHLICAFTYGHNRSENLNLNGSEFEKSVKKFYTNKNYGNFARLVHRILAAYYYIICDPKINSKWNGNSGSAFRCLLYHLLHGHCYQELSNLLCCLIFLERVFECQAADNLLNYFSYLLQERQRESKEDTSGINYAVLSSYHNFVIKNFHIFRSCPQLVGQQALNEPKDSLVQFTTEDTVFNAVECVSRSNEIDLRLGTLDGFMKNVTAVACENSLPYALLGSSDGFLRLMDITSRKVVRRLKSHVSTITFICFAGKNRICVASADTTLSIWSSNDYNRIAVLKGHRHNVTGCCADSSGSVLLSSSWDNSVRLWSLRDGKSLSVISDFRCPVNCISHHPVKQQAACGLWNGNIEVWDTVSLERKLVLLGYGGSVKSVLYTSDGINIIASYINSELIIWSSEQGLKISSLKGHILPVKCITHSPAQDIISGSDDCTLKIWPSHSGYSVTTLDACKYGPISLVEFITLNNLAVAFQNSEIWVMDINNGHVISKFTGLNDRISCFSKHQQIKSERGNPDTKWCDSCIVFGTQSGNLLMGDSLTSSSYSVGHLNGRITSIIHTRSIILCGSSDGDIGLFSLPKDIFSQVITGAHEGSVTALSIFEAYNELWALSAAIDKRLKFWTLFKEFQEEPDVVLQKECPSGHKDNITCLCYLPSLEAHVSDYDFKCVLTGSHDNNIILHQKHSETVFQGLQTSITNIGYNDNYILGCAVDGSVALWSRNGKLLSYIPGLDQSSAILAFRVDKDVRETFDVMLAFVDKNGSVKVKKPFQKSYWYSLEGHSKPITSCSTNNNGELVSCSLDGSVSIWKIPVNEPTTKFSHTFAVSGLIFSTSSNLALSADLHGSVILWEIKVSEKLPLIYAVKKTYVEASIQGLSWLKEDQFVCAVTQSVNLKDKYMLDVLSFKTLTVDEQIFYEIRVEMTHTFRDEISCVDACPNSNIIAVGLKSGNCIIISPDCKRILEVYSDWIIGAKIMTDILCVSLLDGGIKCFSIAEILKSKRPTSMSNPMKIYQPAKSNGCVPYPSCLFCDTNGKIYCGDTLGWLHIYSEDSSPYMKKIHSDSVTGICVLGSNIFTSSLDRTIKGWNSETLEQVCQFHSSVPISCLAIPAFSDLSSDSQFLMFGATSGAVHLLKFKPALGKCDT